MKKIVLLLVAAVSVMVAAAQKTVYDANAEVRSVAAFDAIQLSNAFTVIITQSDAPGLAVSASDPDAVSNITTKVENGVLKIAFNNKDNWMRKSPRLKAYISVKDLKFIHAGGACEVRIEGGLNAASLSIDLSGASDLSGQVNVSEKLQVRLSGASDLNISGAADHMVIAASGACKVRALNFTTSFCDIDASGASSVQITAEKELSARLSGASKVQYKGAAMIRDIKTSGASSIARKT